MSRKPRKPDADYEVGYGKPPKATQFQKGRSGNPNGRPRKSRDLHAHFERELNRLITVREGGQTRQITMLEAIVKRVIQGAVKGEYRLLQLLLRYLESCKEREPFKVTAEDEAELYTMLASMANGGADEDRST